MGRSASQLQMAGRPGLPAATATVSAGCLAASGGCLPRRPPSRPAGFLHTVVNPIFELMKAYLMRATNSPERYLLLADMLAMPPHGLRGAAGLPAGASGLGPLAGLQPRPHITKLNDAECTARCSSRRRG